MKMKKTRFKQIIKEEMEKLASQPIDVDEQLLERVIEQVEQESELLAGYEEGKVDLETIAKEATMEVLEQIKQSLLNEEQLSAVIEMLSDKYAEKGSSAYVYEE